MVDGRRRRFLCAVTSYEAGKVRTGPRLWSAPGRISLTEPLYVAINFVHRLPLGPHPKQVSGRELISRRRM
jgi:hypothetical protein